MARYTVIRGVFKNVVFVALDAGDFHVQAGQSELCSQGVIKVGWFPRNCGMAFGAVNT